MHLPCLHFRSALHIKALGEELSNLLPAWKTPQMQALRKDKEAQALRPSGTIAIQQKIHNLRAWLNSFLPLKYKFFWEHPLLYIFSICYNTFPILTIDREQFFFFEAHPAFFFFLTTSSASFSPVLLTISGVCWTVWCAVCNPHPQQTLFKKRAANDCFLNESLLSGFQKKKIDCLSM